MTRIVVVGGSNRQEAQSHRIAEIIAQEIVALGAEADLLSFRDVSLPLWDESKWDADAPADSPWKTVWPAISARLAAADGVVVVTPEWHGMASPQVKNLMACCDRREVAFKPGYIVSVSVGTGGAYPVAELRAHAVKNNYLHWLPEHLIVRDAAGFKPGQPDNTAPDWLALRMRHGLELLIAFAEAAKPIRESKIDWQLIKNGM